MDQNFMKEKNILQLVISMSLPMVISMAVNSLYNIVDSYFVAKISDGIVAGVSGAEPYNLHCGRIWHRNECQDRILSWRRG